MFLEEKRVCRLMKKSLGGETLRKECDRSVYLFTTWKGAQRNCWRKTTVP